MRRNKQLFIKLLARYNRYRRKLLRVDQGKSPYRRRNLLIKRLEKLQERLLAMKEIGRVTGLTAALSAGLLLTSSDQVMAQQLSLKTDNVLQVALVERDAKPVFTDWDGDGDPDLFIGGKLIALTDSTSVGVKYYQNDGGRFFEAQSPFPDPIGTPAALVDSARISPAFVDLDGDGDLDAFTGLSNGTVSYYRNDEGALVLANGAENPFDGVKIGDTNNASPVFADVDGDGDMDAIFGKYDGLIAYYRNDGGTYVLLGDGTNDPNPFVDVNVGASASPTFVDWDGDGDLDLFVGNNAGEITYFPNIEGVFNAASAEENPLGNVLVPFRAAPALADIDADGDLDVFVGSSSGNIMYLENEGGEFTPIGRNQLGLGIEFDNLNDAFVDIDGDGDMDLFSGEFYGLLYHYINNDGQFSPAASNPLDSNVIHVDYLAAPAFADIDNDGDMDAFVGSYQQNISYLRNDDGVFTLVTGTENPFNDIDAGQNENIAFVDWDGDGDMDAFIGNKAGEVKYFVNNEGVFSEVTGSDNPFEGMSFATEIFPNHPTKPALADIDGDGDMDAMVGMGNGDVALLMNEDGVLTLTPDVFPWNFVRSSAPRFVDLDQDGDPDLIVTNAAGHTYYFENSEGSVAVSDVRFNLETSVFPNPTTEMVRLDIPWSKGTATVQLYSATGQLLKGFRTPSNVTEISLQQLPAGLYIIRVTGQEGGATKKVWKQ
ncbi:MAG: T9SS type A sorting domain-containing protein [Saprospiraceae bacterium]|nr:T9SS type A sorting domain-containing protein [Saprospiraceae bacterium]